MGILRSLGTLGEVIVYARAFGNARTVIPPRWEFFEDIAEKIPPHAHAILEFGIGTARLIKTVLEKKILDEDGIYIGVECDPRCMQYVRHERTEVSEDPRVYLVEDLAQNVTERLHEILEGRSIQAIISSIPHSTIPREESHKIWDGAVRHASDDAVGILYNVIDAEDIMQSHWENVQTTRTKQVHYGIPPEFNVHQGDIPIRPTYKTNGKAQHRALSRSELHIPPGFNRVTTV